ncbi:MAG TPA: flagellar hook-basal body complex protein FliE [Candidatus Enterococcus avicola]|uniref:Flagellar hook-basal body complex protein FliE n=1 Tax=Candidatus Enterococcus avicola TaxID=2838561 RepID=A0A9D2F6G2_9ENTE|nr:flagellar hook-basal body complex protein FliE [Candidatus Enterococcus avicola]
MNELNYTNQLLNYRNDLQNISIKPTAAQEQVDEKGNTFSDYMDDAFSKLEEKIAVMDQDTRNVITGEESDLAQVMIHISEAQLMLQAATQVRNKCLEAYNDVKNMQF